MKMRSADHSRPVGVGGPRSDEGAVAVIVAVAVVMLIGLIALAVDFGAMYQERRMLQTAADAAALAAVQELPKSTTAARDKVAQYVALNAPNARVVSVTFSSQLATNDTVRVVLDAANVGDAFTPVLGAEPTSIGAHAAARVTSVVSYGDGVMPMGVFPSGGHETAVDAYGYQWGQTVTIKKADGTTGNYGWVALEGQGCNDLKTLLSGGGGSASIGEMCETEPGYKDSANRALADWIGNDHHTFAEVCTLDSNGVAHINRCSGDPASGCRRLILVPIIVNPNATGSGRYEYPNGRKDLEIIGFAQFFITSDLGCGGSDTITGKFVKTVTSFEVEEGPVGQSGQVHYSLVE
jgi:Flp pilus assembly protein TadG